MPGSNQNNPSIDPGPSTWSANTQRTSISFNKTDLDGTSRDSQLNGVIPGSTIRVTETADPTKSWFMTVQEATDYPNHVAYSVVRTENTGDPTIGQPSTCDFTVPIPNPTAYYEEFGYYDVPESQPSWAIVSTAISLDGVVQPDSGSAYGIRLGFQPGSIPNDWTLVPAPGGINSGLAQIEGGESQKVSREFLGEFSTESDQDPTGLGYSQRIRVNFGAGGNTVDDEFTISPDGFIECLKNSIQYNFDAEFRFKRTSGGGESLLVGWLMYAEDGVEANAVQLGRTFQALIDDAKAVFREEFLFSFSPSVGSLMWIEIARDESFNNNGGIGIEPITGSLAANLTQPPSAFLSIYKSTSHS